jgi:predicted ATP-grasp superfamily ATP-dependent carboligase
MIWFLLGEVVFVSTKFVVGIELSVSSLLSCKKKSLDFSLNQQFWAQFKVV